MIAFLQTNWLDLAQAVSIIIGFAFTIYSLRKETQTRRIQNLLEIVKGHRDVWMSIIDKPELARILERNVDLKANPISPAEDRIVRLSIMHIFTAFESSRTSIKGYLPGIGKDVADYLSRPIPNKVWRDVKELQSKDFVKFVEGHISSPYIESNQFNGKK